MMGRCIFHQNASAFWDFHDWIFANQEEIHPDNLKDKVLEFAKGKSARRPRSFPNASTTAPPKKKSTKR